ncbi:MAG: YybH family protein [Limisphaerales bacterium]
MHSRRILPVRAKRLLSQISNLKKRICGVMPPPFAAQYTEDGQLLWEDREIIKGRKAIEAEWRKDMGGPGRTATVTSLEVEQHGDWAFESGKFVVTAPDGKTIYDGKYICIWKRVTGEWKIHRDMGNKNAPAK